MKKQIIVSVVALWVLAACTSVEHEDIKAWMNEQTKEMRGDVPALPKVEEFTEVPYDAGTFLSPFSNSKILTGEVAATDSAAPSQDRPKQPLENFPLEDLRVTGVIIDGKAPYALVQPPAPNKPKQVRIGEYVGQNYGRVTAITKDGMTVAETVKDSNGTWVEREVPKLLPRGGEK